MKENPLKWNSYQVGMTPPEIAAAGISFKRKEWDLGSERFIGMRFSELIPILIRESRFDLAHFTEPAWIRPFQGGILRANLKVYRPKPHEKAGQIRKSNEGYEEFHYPIEKLPNGQLHFEYSNPLTDRTLASQGLAVAFTSKVTLNNLSCPGTDGGKAHFPMLDIVHPPTQENVERIINEVRERCELKRFFVLRSSDNGMMIIGPELYDEPNFIALLEDSHLINHIEVAGEFWVDDRWTSHSTRKYFDLTGDRLNAERYCGELRATALPPTKPEEPLVVAASF